MRWTGPAAAVFVVAAAIGCYEIPPEIPQGYIGSSAVPGWPPLAVYEPDAFHPRNRWFQRAYSPRGARDEILPVHADLTAGPARKLSHVDEAEIEALLESIEAAGRGAARTERADVADAVFRSDLLAEASRLHAAGAASDPLVASCLRLALTASREPVGPPPPHTVPPPLREGAWVDEAPPGLDALLPSPRDPRWARFARRSGSEDAAFLRMRVALDADGGCALLPLASECLEVSAGEDGPIERRWRFDRAEWVQGRDPWRIVDDAESCPLELQALAKLPRASASQVELVRTALEPVRRLLLSPSARSRAAPSSAGGSGDGSPARARPR